MPTHDLRGTSTPGQFTAPPPGKHKAVIVEGRVSGGNNAQDGDWSFVWNVIDDGESHHGAMIWDNVFTAKTRKGKENKAINRFAMYVEAALGVDTNKPFDLEGPQDFVGKIAMIELHEEEYDGKKRMKVTYGGVTRLDGDTAKHEDVANELIRRHKDRAEKKAAQNRDNAADDTGNPY